MAKIVFNSNKDTETTSPTASYAFGPGGLFNTPGLGRARKRKKVMPAMVKEISFTESGLRAFLQTAWSVTTKADYPWDQCVEENRRRYGDIETARKVCGSIRAKYGRKEITAKERQAIEQALGLSPLGGFLVFKDASGAIRWIASSSNAYEDFDREVVSYKAQLIDCERMNAIGDFGPLRWWHMGDLTSGVDIGRCDFSAMHGRMRIESGTFKDRRIAEACMRRQKELSLSLGFTHPHSEPDSEGVYHHIRTFERSLLPRQKAANPYTAFAVMKENDMTTLEKKWKEFVALNGGDEALAKQYVDAVAGKQASLDRAGVRTKEMPALTTEDIWGEAAEIATKRGGTSGPDERAAMFANLRKAGDYDESELGGGGRAQTSDRPRGSGKRRGSAGAGRSSKKVKIRTREADAVADEDVTTKRGGTSGPDERAAMFANLRKAGDYDESELGGGGRAQASDRPRGSGKRRGSASGRSSKKTPIKSRKEAGETGEAEEQDEFMLKAFPPGEIEKEPDAEDDAPGAEDTEDEAPEDMADGEEETKADNPWESEDGGDGEDDGMGMDGGGGSVADMTVGQLQGVLALALSKILMQTTKEADALWDEIDSIRAVRTKEKNTIEAKLNDLHTRLKELEGDASPQQGYRASVAGAVVGDNHRLKEQQPVVDPLVANMLQGLFNPTPNA